MAKTDGQRLQEMWEIAVNVGEEPYAANRYAVKDLDIQNDLDVGGRDLRDLFSGIHKFISVIEDFENAAEDVARKSDSFVR